MHKYRTEKLKDYLLICMYFAKLILICSTKQPRIFTAALLRLWNIKNTHGCDYLRLKECIELAKQVWMRLPISYSYLHLAMQLL